MAEWKTFERPLEDLPKADLETLAQMCESPGRLQKAEVLAEWTDDHRLCFGVRLTVLDHDGSEKIWRTIEFGLWWANPALAGWLDCVEESATARSLFAESIKDQVQDAMDEKED